MTVAHDRAPAFQLEVRAPFLWCLAHALLWALACCLMCLALAVQVRPHFGPPGQLACALLGALALPWVCCAAWRSQAQASWQLLWEGQAWYLRSGPTAAAAAQDARRQLVEVQVALDFSGFLLLCFRPVEGFHRPATYLALSQGQHPGQWLYLRWALFSSRGMPPAAAPES